MLNLDTFSDTHRRLLAHACASLREHITDELEYDREPDFAPLEPDEIDALGDVLYFGLTDLMNAMHPEEAEKIEAEIQEQRAQQYAAYRARLPFEQAC